jgi:transposase-like protein
MTRELTDKQRAAMVALQEARASGTGLSACARTHGLNARQVHDSISALRRRGALPPTDRPRPRKTAFVAVRMVNATRSSQTMSPRPGMVCRLIHAGGLVIECGEWPPAAWLLSLASGQRDAAS